MSLISPCADAQCSCISFICSPNFVATFASLLLSHKHTPILDDAGINLCEILDAGFDEIIHQYCPKTFSVCNPPAGNKSWRTLPLNPRRRRQRPARPGETIPVEALRLLPPPLAIRVAHHRLDPHRTPPIAESSCRSWHQKWLLVATAGLRLLADHSLLEERRCQRPCHRRTHLEVPPSAVAEGGHDLRRRQLEIVVAVLSPRLPFTLDT